MVVSGDQNARLDTHRSLPLHAGWNGSLFARADVTVLGVRVLRLLDFLQEDVMSTTQDHK